MDEPTNGVDPVSRRDFWRILYQLLREKVTIFLSTAYLDEAERCNRLALIHRGGLLACGTPEEIRKLMRGTILEIRGPDPRRAASILREQCPTEPVGLFGDRLHVVSMRPEETAKRVETNLAAAGLAPWAVRVAAASLEDVFVSVLGQRGEGGDAGGMAIGAAQPRAGVETASYASGTPDRRALRATRARSVRAWFAAIRGGGR